MSGHNKWSKIKHQKKKNDKRKSKLFSKLVQEIQVAARKDPDPETNAELREAIERAKEKNMPSDNIDRAIQRVKDQKEKGNLNKVPLEGFTENGIGLIIDTFTDNKNRTVAEVRHILNSNGGELGEKGSTKWKFNRRAALTINKAEWDEELELELIDYGLEDVKETSKALKLICPIEDLSSFEANLKEKNIETEKKETIWLPKNPKELSKEEQEKLTELITELEENNDVENVYANVDF
jgi:YebC/PmpR family DNA-binding regulatory protein